MTFGNISISNTLFIELLEVLASLNSNKIALQKIVNLLKQLLNAQNVFMLANVDNTVVFASDNGSLLCNEVINNICFKNSDKSNSYFSRSEICWWNEYCVIPLSVEGQLILSWEKKPGDNELEYVNILATFLTTFLKNRAQILLKEKNSLKEHSLLKLQNIISADTDLKSQLSFIASEILSIFNVSRCQIKFFASTENMIYESDLSIESVAESVLEAKSVMPLIEGEWVEQIQSNQNYILNQKQINISQGIESFLSIRSILGCHMVYKGKIIGVLILHQCDYERVWEEDEIFYIRNYALFLGILVGKEIEQNEKTKEHFSVTNLHTDLIKADDFLRELNHTQIHCGVRNEPFSLIMIDIEKLKDINLKMGFVAGNLVISQTARYLKRLYDDLYKIARYNSDEFVVILKGVEQNKARIETEKLKEHLSGVSVFGIGLIDYSFSFVTYPVHTDSLSELLALLEQAMILSKSRGKFQISSYDELSGQPKQNWHQLVTKAIPEIVLKRASLKTGPEIIETINNQILEYEKKKIYSADILDSIQSLALALDAKDSYTEGHSNRVSEYAYLLAKELGLDLQELEWIRLAANMHDIGKIGIPESILCKPAKLTKEEYEVMKKHPVIGAKILKPIKPLEKVSMLVLYHHEYWDGSGYPQGLIKNDIPIGSRIVSIVDAFQAMTSNRPYRPSLPFEEAISRLSAGKEKQWDPELVEIFIKLIS